MQHSSQIPQLPRSPNYTNSTSRNTENLASVNANPPIKAVSRKQRVAHPRKITKSQVSQTLHEHESTRCHNHTYHLASNLQPNPNHTKNNTEHPHKLKIANTTIKYSKRPNTTFHSNQPQPTKQSATGLNTPNYQLQESSASPTTTNRQRTTSKTKVTTQAYKAPANEITSKLPSSAVAQQQSTFPESIKSRKHFFETSPNVKVQNREHNTHKEQHLAADTNPKSRTRKPQIKPISGKQPTLPPISMAQAKYQFTKTTPVVAANSQFYSKNEQSPLVPAWLKPTPANHITKAHSHNYMHSQIFSFNLRVITISKAKGKRTSTNVYACLQETTTVKSQKSHIPNNHTTIRTTNKHQNPHNLTVLNQPIDTYPKVAKQHKIGAIATHVKNFIKEDTQIALCDLPTHTWTQRPTNKYISPSTAYTRKSQIFETNSSNHCPPKRTRKPKIHTPNITLIHQPKLNKSKHAKPPPKIHTHRNQTVQASEIKVTCTTNPYSKSHDIKQPYPLPKTISNNPRQHNNKTTTCNLQQTLATTIKASSLENVKPAFQLFKPENNDPAVTTNKARHANQMQHSNLCPYPTTKCITISIIHEAQSIRQ
eukprot:gene2984-1966_t